MKVGQGLASCTTKLEFGYIETIEGHLFLQEYRIVLIDTPGFDDTHKTDFAILENIATWLKDWYVVPEGSKAK
jgi:GTPase Era involved in 16S rRNA processing